MKKSIMSQNKSKQSLVEKITFPFRNFSGILYNVDEKKI